jgi:hypothetical protein
VGRRDLHRGWRAAVGWSIPASKRSDHPHGRQAPSNDIQVEKGPARSQNQSATIFFCVPSLPSTRSPPSYSSIPTP